ncbi:multidrug effflux MFS transporter [Diaminobutyricibacter tongyongensis]|uniref:Multidrug effflux MFS transporter n=1 Tax=Leifsonia tongyongensis TaxID=1268043 RepID=A0A6L9Y203_9MICO|nr:multidrug effflux MFS transporter [Diaminobutyricibacter tongyongensis]NEN07712.1 multidrug effflux MFS transporter [Diaminobutyricibacter tongyongensis]
MTYTERTVATHASGRAPTAEVRSKPGLPLVIVLGMLTVFGPISMDLYLPVLPALGRDLAASTSATQLTVTTCLLGLAFGQLIAGPLSDRFGRRRPLLIGVAAYIAASVLCAVSPTIAVLIVARSVQGLAGAVGLVIAQAAGRDIYSGGKLVRYYGRIVVLSGLAAIVGPVVGGQLAGITDWRGIFFFLAAIGALILLAVVFIFRETLPMALRTTGGLAHTNGHFRVLLTDRLFLGALLVSSFASAALFAYISGATFVLQDIYGLSPQQYALAFGLNSAGFVVFGWLAGRYAERWSERGVLIIGIGMITAASLGLLTTAILRLPVWAAIISLLALASGVATTSPPSTSLSMRDYPHIAGTAASLLGVSRFLFGGLAAPLVGLAGALDMVPLGIVTVVASVLSGIAYVVFVRTGGRTTRARAI